MSLTPAAFAAITIQEFERDPSLPQKCFVTISHEGSFCQATVFNAKNTVIAQHTLDTSDIMLAILYAKILVQELSKRFFKENVFLFRPPIQLLCAPLHLDHYGRTWTYPKNELCCICGQPDSCGDCNHNRLSRKEVEIILLGENNPLRFEEW